MFNEEVKNMLIVTKRLIEKLKQKDEVAFEIIYYEYEKLVYYICYTITKDKHASEDLTQETFLKLLTSLDNYNEKGKFKQYIMMIARNLSKNYVTRVQNKKPIYDDDIIYSHKDETNHNLMLYDIKDYITELETEIVILHIIHKLKFREIAEYLDLSIGKVQSSYYNGIKTLRKEL
jgi:RNA polymerase sigma-70 factor (ECF subfamily)